MGFLLFILNFFLFCYCGIAIIEQHTTWEMEEGLGLMG